MSTDSGEIASVDVVNRNQLDRRADEPAHATATSLLLIVSFFHRRFARNDYRHAMQISHFLFTVVAILVAAGIFGFFFTIKW